MLLVAIGLLVLSPKPVYTTIIFCKILIASFFHGFERCRGRTLALALALVLAELYTIVTENRCWPGCFSSTFFRNA